MYVSPWLQAALLPKMFDVCGLLCRPLSVWHAYILRTVGNRYVTGGAAVDSDAAAEVLMYAAQDYAGGHRLYHDARYRDRHRKRVVKAMKRHEWPRINAAILDYLGTCSRTPNHTEKLPKKGEAKAKPVAAPTEWVMVEYLSGGDPTRIEAAWNAPYVVARCLLDARRNVSGEDDSLISERDEERIDIKIEAREAANVNR